MHIEVIYDIRQAGSRYGFLPMFLGALTVYAAVEWYRGRRWTLPSGVAQPGYSPRTFCLFFAALTLLTYVLTWGSYYSLTRALRNGTATTLEGVVSNFHPASDMKDHESFVLNGNAFSYSKYALKQGFNTLGLEGSPIADGSYVRLAYRDDSILELTSATASAPAGNRSWPDVSFAARHTASATSDSVVTALGVAIAAKMRCAKGAYASGTNPSMRRPPLCVNRVVGA